MTADILQIGGWWWPKADIHARPIITRDCDPDIQRLLAHIPGRDCIVQAGANVGVYALALADHFRSVITAEPEPVNHACLVRNLEARDSLKRVTALKAAFGERLTACEPVIYQPVNCGAHYVAFDKGNTPVWTIDGLELTACDAIWLDCEGSETFALKGAVETIRRFWPTLAAEDKGLDQRFFGAERGGLQKFMAEHGYEQVDAIGRDKVFRRPA